MTFEIKENVIIFIATIVIFLPTGCICNYSLDINLSKFLAEKKCAAIRKKNRLGFIVALWIPREEVGIQKI